MSEINLAREVEPEAEFTCTACGLSENYDYKGKQPPFSKLINMSNECYVMKDPFSPPNRGQFLILGSDCTLCKKPFCQATDCSFFYINFYCLHCALQNINLFPPQFHVRLNKCRK
ncbi:Cysteine-rich domain [Homalodisca vitripennis]|nr:Cysteine-rich domain [Homalodisca vitripennis]KAG8320322.1 Cysteine-rich domain [Homalodisca vitripennis]